MHRTDHESVAFEFAQREGEHALGDARDAVLLPEYLNDRLPVIGRGGLTWKVTIRRQGPPVHEVMRPDEPNVILAGAELVVQRPVRTGAPDATGAVGSIVSETM